MSANTAKTLGYSYLLVTTLVFSSLADGTFLLYIFVRGTWTPIEAILAAILLCFSFSWFGQRISKIKNMGAWIMFVSAFSIGVNYELFYDSSIVDWTLIIFVFGGTSLIFGAGGWSMLTDLWEYLSPRRISKKPIVILVASGGLIIFTILAVASYLTAIVSFFDSHSWVVTLIGIVASLLGGILIGRRKKKS